MTVLHAPLALVTATLLGLHWLLFSLPRSLVIAVGTETRPARRWKT